MAGGSRTPRPGRAPAQDRVAVLVRVQRCRHERRHRRGIGHRYERCRKLDVDGFRWLHLVLEGDLSELRQHVNQQVQVSGRIDASGSTTGRASDERPGGGSSGGSATGGSATGGSASGGGATAGSTGAAGYRRNRFRRDALHRRQRQRRSPSARRLGADDRRDLLSVAVAPGLPTMWRRCAATSPHHPHHIIHTTRFTPCSSRDLARRARVRRARNASRMSRAHSAESTRGPSLAPRSVNNTAR